MRVKSVWYAFAAHCSSVAVGLFLARVLLEVVQRPLPRIFTIVISLAAAFGAFAASRWLVPLSRTLVLRRPALVVNHWPGLLSLIYVVWPRRDPLVAGGVAVLAVLAWLVSGERRILPHWTEPLADGVVFVLAAVVYAGTAAPDVLPADFGEFQLVSALLGVAHPPGFPLYTLAGHAFIRLFPWGTPAYRLNLMSGLLAAGTLVLVARTTRLWARGWCIGGKSQDANAEAQRRRDAEFKSQDRAGAPTAAVGDVRVLVGGLAAALTLGTATTYWAQATIANVRTPAVFFTALALYALSRFATAASGGDTARKEADADSCQKPGFSEKTWFLGEVSARDRALILLGLALGLGGEHYPPLAFVSLFFVLYVLLVDPRLAVQPRRWWRPALAMLAGFLPLIYLPIAGAVDAPLAPPGLDTVSGFLHHFLAQGFSGDMFAFANVVDLPHRLALIPTLYLFQFDVVLLVAALLGLIGLAWRDWRLFVLLAGSLALHTFVTVTYRAPQTVEYLMPAYLPVAIAVGLLPCCACSLLAGRPFSSTRHRWAGTGSAPGAVCAGVCALVLWAGLRNGWGHAASYVELAGDHTARETVAPLLEQAPAGALVLADWRWATPLWYLQQVEGVRPDVEVRYVYPVAEEAYRETWQRHVLEEGQADPDRAILLTHFYEFSGYTAEPWASGFLIRPRPVTEPVAPLTPVGLTFGDRVRLLGYWIQQDRFYPGQVAEFVLAWQPVSPLDVALSDARPMSAFTLRLLDTEGKRVAQADRALASDVAVGELRFARLVLPLYPALPPGQYQVALGAYVVSDAGFEDLTVDGGEAMVGLTELDLVAARDVGARASGQGCGGYGRHSGGPACLTTSRPPRGPRMDLVTLHRQSVPFAGGPTLVGVDYDRSVPGVLRVYLHWRGAGEADVWQVRVWTADGPGRGNRAPTSSDVADADADGRYPLAPVMPGAYRTIGIDLPDAGDGSLWLSLTGPEGEQAGAAGPWAWPVQEIRLPGASPEARFVPLGDEMAVIGFSPGRTYPSPSAGSGRAVAVDVTLLALRPLTCDDAMSVRLVDSAGSWLARHDMQPALSAIPTLKWIRGSRVVDRHLLDLPEGFTGGEVRATLVVYERFRLASIPAMDGRFDEVPLGTWSLP